MARRLVEMSVKVGVIGAGAAGLCAARHISAHSDKFQPIVFEQTDCVGGTWVYTDKRGTDQYGLPIHSSMYKKMKTNLPKEVMAFPDFPFPVDGPSFVTHAGVRAYLENYANHFDLMKYIKFQNTVVKAVPLNENQGWVITARNVQNQKEQDYRVSHILVCNGHYSVPRVPDIPGLDKFQGKILHSHDYRDAEEFSGRTIVCLGAGASGQDISLELSETAQHVYVSHNKAPIKAPLPKNVLQIEGIEEAYETGFKLRSGDRVEANMLLLCTGYHFTFPFLPEGFLTIKENRVEPLYKHFIHCSNPTTCFVGIPLTICPFPFFDLQIRFYMKYILGELALPSEGEMIKDAEEDFKNRIKSGMPARHAHTMGPRQWQYQDDLAQLGGLKPSSQVVRNLYDAVHDTRVNDLVNYKNLSYRLVDEDNFIAL